MRVVARARSGSAAPLTSDAAAFTALGLDRCSPSHPCEPVALSGYAPRAGLEALQRARVVGRPTEGFERAISECSGARASALGARPLLAMQRA